MVRRCRERLQNLDRCEIFFLCFSFGAGFAVGVRSIVVGAMRAVPHYHHAASSIVHIGGVVFCMDDREEKKICMPHMLSEPNRFLIRPRGHPQV